MIKDWKTGDSLQYAFIEFETVREVPIFSFFVPPSLSLIILPLTSLLFQAENAYLKTNNILLDDRRIHVDFSQSVAKQMREKRMQQQKQQQQQRKPRARGVVYGSKPVSFLFFLSGSSISSNFFFPRRKDNLEGTMITSSKWMIFELFKMMEKIELC